MQLYKQQQQLNFSYSFQLSGHWRVQRWWSAWADQTNKSAIQYQRKWMRGRVNFHMTCSVITDRGLSKRTLLTSLLISASLYMDICMYFHMLIPQRAAVTPLLTHSVISITVKELHLCVMIVELKVKYETIIILSYMVRQVCIHCFVILEQIQVWLAFSWSSCSLLSRWSSLTFLPEE